jgi:hypothetical protein
MKQSILQYSPKSLSDYKVLRSTFKSSNNLPPVSFFCIFQVIVDTPKGDDPIGLDMQHMGKGQAWLNGYPIGRYWPRTSSPNDKCTSTCNYRGKFFPDKCRTGCGEPTQRWYNVFSILLYFVEKCAQM